MGESRMRGFWLRLKALAQRRRLDADLEDELAFHLAQREAQNLAGGMSPEEARHAARRAFGNVARAKETARGLWCFRALEDFFGDLRYSARVLSRNPGFSAAAILVIALGVGINVGMFSVLNGVALRRLPVPSPQQMVTVDQAFHGKFRRNIHGEPTLFSQPEYEAYRDANHAFSGLLAYEPFLEATLGGGHSERLYGALASCNYFDVLQLPPAQGRGFLPDDCSGPGASPVVVISDALWRGSFGSDPAVLGQTIYLNHSPFRVVGIAAPGFIGTEPVPASFWAPLVTHKSLEPNFDFSAADRTSWLALLGRVRPGVTLDQVRRDLAVIAARFDLDYPGRTTVLTVRTATFLGRPEEHSITMTVGGIILAAFAMVLLIACANVAGLLLARGTTRHKEIAIRLSIGAGRGRVIRLLLSESLLLSAIGGFLGTSLAFSSFDALLKLVLSHLPAGTPEFVFNVQPDLRVFAYALFLTLLTGFAFGLLPALHASRFDLHSALKEGSPTEAGKPARAGFLRRLLVATQVAVSMVLLLAAGLLLRGLYFTQTIDPGFERKDIFVVDAFLLGQGFTPERAAGVHRQLGERFAALPGVDSLALALHSPLNGDHHESDFRLPGSDQQHRVEFNYVSGEFFAVLGVPIVRGRSFTEAESRNGAPLVIVSESTARRFWPGQDPVGKTLRFGGEKTPREVVGIARDIQISHPGNSGDTYMYFTAGPEVAPQLQFLIHRRVSFAGMQSDIRSAIRSVDAELPVNITRLEDNLEFWRVQSRLWVALSGSVGALALVLVSVGVYGMVSYAVTRRLREIGIRIAMGASAGDVLRVVCGRTLRPVLIGAAAGIAASFGAAQILRELLYGVSTLDPIAFLGVPSFLLLVASLAGYIPARRATRVDPVTALRYE